ncbi:hypothetical protein NG798_26935 [Ancylothrix sp. C2]|uniref:hypothetical protein n=1 Tax=Ancylothrix sp. D3o TaxID=2953691 RepID=UPI0021BB89D3|nr:hypothetical protein [Ancylothrix sp. D3o]MCT7953440.1 hypothetical protein [Ancylothrix sp. D3o]
MEFFRVSLVEPVTSWLLSELISWSKLFRSVSSWLMISEADSSSTGPKNIHRPKNSHRLPNIHRHQKYPSAPKISTGP